jgi:hypothetical protein
MDRIVFVLFAGPDRPCMAQHALIFARDVARRGGEARIVFEGQSPKLLIALHEGQHPMFSLFNQARAEGLLSGVCRGCAAAHGALDASEALGLTLLDEAFGHASMVPFMEQGYQIVAL